MQTSVQMTKIFAQDDFNAFAALSGDYNPIHVDPEYASNTRFGKPVAHGALLVTILRGLTEQLLAGGKQISHAVKFPAPTFAGEALEFSASMTKQSNGAHHIALQVRNLKTGTVSCEGEAIVKQKKA
ncbi:MAG: hydratase [Robiginitomaculum sp.]|nr:MAG: hydratase [Robiginitomaculum sp.]